MQTNLNNNISSNDEHGQLVPAEFDVPQAIDNSGKIAWTRIEPEGLGCFIFLMLHVNNLEV